MRACIRKRRDSHLPGQLALLDTTPLMLWELDTWNAEGAGNTILGLPVEPLDSFADLIDDEEPGEPRRSR